MWAKASVVLCLLLANVTVQAKDQTFNLLASIRPIALVAQEITAGAPVTVEVLVPANASPHGYGLKPSDLALIDQADLMVWLGKNAEPYLKDVIKAGEQTIAWENLPEVSLLPIRELNESELDHKQHNHADHPAHSAGLTDPHFWFSTENAIILAQHIVRVIALKKPQLKTILEANLKHFEETLRQLREQQKHSLQQAGKVPFLLAHDAYQYLESDLQIRAIGSLAADPEIKPGAKHLLALKSLSRELGVGCVLQDPMVPTQLVDKVVASNKVKTAVIHPLGWDFESMTYSGWLEQVYHRLTLCISQQ